MAVDTKLRVLVVPPVIDGDRTVRGGSAGMEICIHDAGNQTLEGVEGWDADEPAWPPSKADVGSLQAT